ncbi:tripartite tricarboxylate transporter substrate binding protein [Acidovorax sp. sif0732]|uniref:Bug family tripartite tricarboxylate transporter substrate binding protein n=2 Tax=unclassified Acidovorax TaxID=2684926 RepID=UPI0021077130|nr:tripartite tricarboxylate transporter substrate binding protein [Acidovorax sp. sif0732]
MNNKRRDMLSRRASLAALTAVAAVAAAGALAPIAATAQPAYPTTAVRLVVPFAAAGGTDSVARVVVQVMGTRLGQPVVVDNRPGAGGSIGTLAVTQATPDGHTLLLGSNGTMVLNPLLYPQLKYQVDRDLVPVAGIAAVPFLVAANPQFGATDLKGLLAAAKQKDVTFASPGNGTTNHLAGVLLGSMAGVNLTHVPYRGTSPATNDVVGGVVNFLSGDFGTLLPMVNAGKLRALAVTGTQRASILPNVPTVAETLPGFDATGWFGVFAPKGTSQAVVDKLSTEFLHTLKDPRVAQRLQELGGMPMPLNAAQLKALIGTETAKWQKLIKDNKVTADALQ